MKREESKRSIQAKETREKILRATIDLVNEKGLGNVTIDDIQERTGVSRGLFYNYFKNIDDVVSEVFLIDDNQYENLWKEIEKHHDERSLDKLLLFINYVGLMHDNIADKKFVKVHYTNLLSNPKRGASIWDSNRTINACIIQTLKEAKEAGELPQDTEITRTASDIMIIVRGVVYDCLISGQEDEHIFSSLMVRIVSSYLAGLSGKTINFSTPVVSTEIQSKITNYELRG